MSGSLSGQSLYPPEKPEEVIAQLFASSHKAFAAGELEKAESDSRQVSGISLDQLGAIYLKLERYSLSEKAYREAAKVFALSPYPFIGLGVLSLNRGNYDEGMKWVNKILELNPLHPEARHVLGKLYFMKGEFSKASEELRDAYQLNPANTSVGYTLALAFLKQKKVEEAARVFQDMSGRLGESPQLHVLIGRAYRQTADSLDLSYAVYLEKAVAEFQEAVRLQPDFPRVHHYLGLTYLLQKGKQAFPLAMKEFVTELKREPDEYFANFYLGVLLATQRKHQKALPYLEKATRLDPQNPDAFLYLGQTFYQSSRYEDAIPALERSVRLTTDPSRFGYQVSKAHYMLGQALARVGRRGEAKVHLERSQELKSELSKGEAEDIQEHIYGTNKRPGSGMGSGDFSDLASNTEPHVILARDRPSDRARAELEKAIAFYRNVCSSAYQNLARAYIQRSAFGPAADYLEKAVSWDDTAPDIYFNLGLAGLRAGHLSRAFRALKKAMERKPAKKETLRVLGSLALKLVEERETGLALETVNYLLERNDSVADLFLLRGQIYAQKGLFAEALAEFQKGLQKNPRLARAHYLSGTVLIRTGQLRAARQEFDKVLELNPNHAGALYHEAFVLIEERKMKQAAPLLEKAIRLAPDNADAYYQLGKIQQNQGQLIQAIANLETAAHLNPSGAHIFYQLSRAYRKAGRKEEGTRALERYRQLKKEQEERRLKNHSGPQ